MHKPTQEELDDYNTKILNRIVSTSYPTKFNFIDLSGQNIDDLHVDCYAGRNKKKDAFFWCTCKCGNKILKSSRSLRDNTYSSCGCRFRSATSERNKKINHGDSKRGKITHLYNVWCEMRYRCYNPTNKKYINYGARGIRICDEWLDKKNGYINFKEWALSHGYKDNCGLSIDRIDVNGNYCPENCRWADVELQNNNQRKTIYCIIGRYALPITIWSKIMNINKKTVYDRINRGWSYKDAIFTPKGKERGKYSPIIEIPEKYDQYNKYDEFIKSGKIIEVYSDFLKVKFIFT